MKKLAHIVLILIIAYPLAGIVVTSCAGESDCSTAGRRMLTVDFKREVDNVIVKDTLDSLTITAFYTDSIIINNDKDMSSVRVPLRYTNDTTILVLHFTLRSRDTVTIIHTNTPNFVSMECGYEMKQSVTDLSYTTYRLDTIYTKNNDTNTDGTTNLELLFKDL